MTVREGCPHALVAWNPTQTLVPASERTGSWDRAANVSIAIHSRRPRANRRASLWAEWAHRRAAVVPVMNGVRRCPRRRSWGNTLSRMGSAAGRRARAGCRGRLRFRRACRTSISAAGSGPAGHRYWTSGRAASRGEWLCEHSLRAAPVLDLQARVVEVGTTPDQKQQRLSGAADLGYREWPSH